MKAASVGAILLVLVLSVGLNWSSASSLSGQGTPGQPYAGYGAQQLSGGVFNSPFPTYSWGNYGYCDALISMSCGGQILNDSYVQQGYFNVGNEIFAQVQMNLDGWGQSANTSSGDGGSPTTIPDLSMAGYAYSTQAATLVTKYQIPYFMAGVLDGYGAAGNVANNNHWVQYATTQYPDLVTYNSAGAPSSKFVRVDDTNFPRQLFNDLVNVKNNIVGTGVAGYIRYWYGIQISQISSDHGTYGCGSGCMFGNESVLDFAQSKLCVDSQGSSCASLVLDVRTKALSTQALSLLITTYHSTDFGQWTNIEFLLGYTYAAYLFQTSYSMLLGGHAFVVVPARSFFVPPSQYPAPYNTTYYRNLNLLQKYEIVVGSSVYGGSETQTGQSVARDLRDCQLHSYGNTGFWLGLWYVSTGGATPTPTQEVQTSRNARYYMPHCAPGSIIDVGQFVPAPSSPGWSTYYGMGQLLDRMAYDGNGVFPSPALSASDPTTSVTLTGGSGRPLLAWLYTNRSSSDSASLTLNASAYHISPSGWVAISAQNWQVVGGGSSATVALTGIHVPARGWNPVYIENRTASWGVEYSNLPVVSASTGGSSPTYAISGPHRFSGWLVVNAPSAPASVTASNTGQVPLMQSLTSLNQTFVGMRWTGSGFQNTTQTGYYFDPVNDLLYVHYVGDNSVSLNVALATTTTSSTTTSTTTHVSTTSTSSTATSSATTSSTHSTTQTTSSSTVSSTVAASSSSSSSQTTTSRATVSNVTQSNSGSPGQITTFVFDGRNGADGPGGSGQGSLMFLGVLPLDPLELWVAFIATVSVLVASGVRATRHH